MDESKSPLLNEFAKAFGEDVVFSKKPFTLTNEFAVKIAKIINNILFDSMIVDFPEIKVVTYGHFCKNIKFYEMTYCNKSNNEIICAKNTFLGDHYVIIENDFNTLKYSDKLIYSHEIIFLNLDKLKYRSFVMNAAAICHEMIHVYDRQFGDGEGLDKYCILKNLPSYEYNRLSHITETFANKQKLAIANNLNVMTTMNKKDKVLDKETIKLMLQALTPEELKSAREKYLKEDENGKRHKISLQHID